MRARIEQVLDEALAVITAATIGGACLLATILLISGLQGADRKSRAEHCVRYVAASAEAFERGEIKCIRGRR